MYCNDLIDAAKNTKKSMSDRVKRPYPSTTVFLDLVKAHAPHLLRYTPPTIRRLILNNENVKYCGHCNKDITEVKDSLYCNMKCYKADPEAGKKISKIKKDLYSDPLWKEQTEGRKIATNMSRLGVAHAMQNPESFDKQRKSAYKRTDTLGMMLQGYEPHALEWLLMYGYEVVQGTSYLKKAGMKLDYIDDEGKTRYSYPDFFVPDLNAFVEVKSVYTYELAKDTQIKNAIKACKDKEKGYILVIVKPKISFSYTMFNDQYILDP